MLVKVEVLVLVQALELERAGRHQWLVCLPCLLLQPQVRKLPSK